MFWIIHHWKNVQIILLDLLSTSQYILLFWESECFSLSISVHRFIRRINNKVQIYVLRKEIWIDGIKSILMNAILWPRTDQQQWRCKRDSITQSWQTINFRTSVNCYCVIRRIRIHKNTCEFQSRVESKHKKKPFEMRIYSPYYLLKPI